MDDIEKKCEPPLPSGSSAYRLVQGDAAALPEAALHMGGRGVLIGTGLYAAGARGKELVKYAVAGTVAIEVFVLAWAWWKNGPGKK